MHFCEVYSLMLQPLPRFVSPLRVRFVIGAFAVAVALPTIVAAQPATVFRVGDLIAGGQTPSIAVARGRFDWFSPSGALNKRMADTLDEFPSDFAMDRAGRLYSPTFFTIRVFDGNGAFIGNFPQFAAAYFLAIAFDAAGNAYVSGGFGKGNFAKTDSSGNLIRLYLLPHDDFATELDAFDIASDQCTVVYPNARQVLQYDICGDHALPQLVSFPSGPRLGWLRILPDGRILVIRGDTILLLAGDGTTIKSYQVPSVIGWSHLAIDIDRQSFWATSGTRAYKIDIPSGSVLLSFSSSDYGFNAITVVGEPRAAVAPSTIPTLSTVSLLAVGFSLAAIALARLQSGA
jgi:hypothetical protein